LILIAFAKSFFLLSPLPPAGGEGEGEGGYEKTFGKRYKFFFPCFAKITVKYFLTLAP
jgi:hypothetical protein